MAFFSIIIPTYNRADRIPATIHSVLQQSYSDFEIIIVDDGSTDNTKAVIEQIKDARIQYIKAENKERASARNKGVEMAKGEFITFLDSDDLLDSSHLKIAFDFIEKNSNIEWFHLKYRIQSEHKISAPDYPKDNESITEKLFIGNYLSCQGVFLKAKVASQNKFNETRSLSGLEDWELWIRMSLKYQLLIINQCTSTLVDYSERSVRSINKEDLIQKMETFMEIILNNPEVQKKYKHLVSNYKCSCYSYIALHIALSGTYRTTTLNYLWKSFGARPSFIFSRRFFATLKHLI